MLKIGDNYGRKKEINKKSEFRWENLGDINSGRLNLGEDMPVIIYRLFQNTLKDILVCDYDEGFIRGIFETYSGVKFKVKEVDCWATGDRVCRFYAVQK